MGYSRGDHFAVRDPTRRTTHASSLGYLHAVRLDDVQLDAAQLLLGVALLLKATIVESVPTAIAITMTTVLMVWRLRVGSAIAAIALLPTLVDNHAIMLWLTSLIVAGFPDRAQRHLLYRTQLTALYLFSGTAKFTPAWFSGAQLYSWREHLWVFDVLPPDLLLVATPAIEIGLAAALWVNPRLALVVGVLFHAAVIVGMSGATGYVVELLIFNGIAAAMLWTVRRREIE